MSEAYFPRKIGEVLDILDSVPSMPIMAGGTDLLVRSRAKGIRHASLLCLERVEGLKRIEFSGGAIRIGAACTFQNISSDAAVRRHAPLLSMAIGVLGSPQIRHMATLGGNLCTASPAGDTLPPLYAMDASVELVSKGGARTLPISEFIIGPGRTAIRPGEILASVIVAPQAPREKYIYYKVGNRKALSIAIVSAAFRLSAGAGGPISSISMAYGSVGPTVLRFGDIERSLAGAPLTPAGLEAASGLVAASVSPISDIRAGADYRREVSANLLLKLCGNDLREVE